MALTVRHIRPVLRSTFQEKPCNPENSEPACGICGDTGLADLRHRERCDCAAAWPKTRAVPTPTKSERLAALYAEIESCPICTEHDHDCDWCGDLRRALAAIEDRFVLIQDFEPLFAEEAA